MLGAEAQYCRMEQELQSYLDNYEASIAGGYWQDHPDMLREIAKSKAHKICITQVENIPYQEQFDMIIQVGTDHLSLIGKFSITYIFELLEALYHIKYGRV